MEAEQKSYRQMLETKEAELLVALKKRDGIEIENEADMFDEVQRATERELVIRNLNRDSTLLRDVIAALKRLENGTYGTCAACEERITARRLAAVPWAALCRDCQERADLEGSERGDGGPPDLADAA